MMRNSLRSARLQGRMADLLRMASRVALQDALSALESGVPEYRIETGVELFDRLQPEQQVAMLEVVTNELLTPDPPTRPSAVRDATILALLRTIRRQVQWEIWQQETGEPFSRTWRHYVVSAACQNNLVPESVPHSLHTGRRDWEEIIEGIGRSVLPQHHVMWWLWIADLDPLQAQRWRANLGVPQDYFDTVAPDPTTNQLSQICSRLVKELELPCRSEFVTD